MMQGLKIHQVTASPVTACYIRSFAMNKVVMSPTFLTVEEVAELLRVSPRSVYDWVSQGTIPHRKAGRRTIFLLTEILEWTANCRANRNSGK
jgi:excisionase family DNA binding protein